MTTATTDWTLESLTESIKRAQAIPKPKWDGFAFTYQEWAIIKKELDIQKTDYSFDRISGLPLWLFDTKEECIKLALEELKNKKWIFILGIPDYDFTIPVPTTNVDVFNQDFIMKEMNRKLLYHA